MAESSTSSPHSITSRFQSVDVAAAKQFYGSAFGWAFNDYGPDYAGIQDPARPRAEVGGTCRRMRYARAARSLLLFSDDLDASVEAVVGAGGRIVNGA